MTSRILVEKLKREKNLRRGSEESGDVLSEVAHRELKDVDEKDDNGHETSPRV